MEERREIPVAGETDVLVIGGGLAGLISGILGVNSYGMAPAGLTSIAVLVGPTFVNGIITIVVAIVAGFALSFLFEKKQNRGA